MHLLTFGQTSIPYEIVRSIKSKTVSITVDKDGVKVVAPDDVEIEKAMDRLYLAGHYL